MRALRGADGALEEHEEIASRQQHGPAQIFLHHRTQNETEEQRQQAADKRKECGKSTQTGTGHWPVAPRRVVVAGAAARDALDHQQEEDEGQQHGRQLRRRHPVAERKPGASDALARGLHSSCAPRKAALSNVRLGLKKKG